jgi:hypothetical protein
MDPKARILAALLFVGTAVILTTAAGSAARAPLPVHRQNVGRCPGYLRDHIKALACGGS